MLLRNLEILSGMKWIIHCLLLILSAFLCISAGYLDSTPPKPVCPLQSKSACTQNGNNKIDMFILGPCGFKGYMKIANCNHNKWDISQNQTVSSLKCHSTVSSENLFKVYAFPIVENASGTTHSSDCGVTLSGNSPYKLNISRCVMPRFVCLIEKKCKTDTLTHWMTEGCNWIHQTPTYFKNDTCNMTCLNPRKTCENAQYDLNCKGDNLGNINNIVISDNIPTCYKCGSPLPNMPKINTSTVYFNTNKTEIDASAAAKVMGNLSSVVSLMGNQTVASISMGNVQGVLKKIQTESEITTSYFIYSSESGISVIEDLDELENFPNAFCIPAEAAKEALNQSAGSAFMGIFRFPNMSKDAENSTVLNDEVYAIEMGTKISNLSENISLTFKYQKVAGTPVCHSWDGSGNRPNWTTEGCSTLEGINNVTCQCKHLTFFAVLMVGSPVSFWNL